MEENAIYYLNDKIYIRSELQTISQYMVLLRKDIRTLRMDKTHGAQIKYLIYSRNRSKTQITEYTTKILTYNENNVRGQNG